MGIWGVLGTGGNPEELWSALKTTIFDVAGRCLGTHHQAKKAFVSQGRMDTIHVGRRRRDQAADLDFA